MTENERQQRMVERILEDERLRGDLEDSAATALINWASERAGSAAADPARPDDAIEADVQAIRKAAQAAARSGESDPARLVEVAQAALAKSGVSIASGAVEATTPAAEQQAAAPSPVGAQAPAAVSTQIESAASSQPAAAEAPTPSQPSATDTNASTRAVAQTTPAETRPSQEARAQPAHTPREGEATPAAPAQRRSHHSTLSDGQSRRKRQRLARFLKRARGGR